MVRLELSPASPEVDPSSCMALLDPLATESYGDFKSLSSRTNYHRELMALCNTVEGRQWARNQPESSNKTIVSDPVEAFNDFAREMGLGLQSMVWSSEEIGLVSDVHKVVVLPTATSLQEASTCLMLLMTHVVRGEF